MSNQTVECIACGHVGALKLRGSVFITIILLFLYIIPGVIYMVWRRGGKVCSACGSSNVKLFVPKPVIQTTPQQDVQEVKTKLVSNDAFSHASGTSIHFDSNGIEQKNCPDCRELIRFDARKCKHCGSMIE